jgi:histidine triad (HIT) family protein
VKAGSWTDDCEDGAMTDCLFCKIVGGDIPANLVYENEFVLAFDDIQPKAPIHKLIIPREHIATANDIAPKHELLVGKMMTAARIIADQTGIAESGYRLVMNCNADGGQEVYHIHLHLIGGKPLSWPPGC